jgi:hypothetical protein
VEEEGSENLGLLGYVLRGLRNYSHVKNVSNDYNNNKKKEEEYGLGEKKVKTVEYGRGN